MPSHNAHGRRRAASGRRRAEPATPQQGRRAAGRSATKRRASPVAPIAGAISAVGVLSGALLAGIPLTAAAPSSEESPAVNVAAGSVPRPEARSIEADPKAQVDFSRTAVPGTASSQPATGSVNSSHLLADGPIQADPDDDTDERPTTEPAAAQPAEQSGLGSPLAQMTTASTFGYRTNPLTGVPGEMHTGIDLTGSCSTPVMAAASGIITEAGWSPYGGGNRIVIDHGDGLKTTYNHLATIAVSVGQTATRGDIVGGVGTTGNSTGCHLHFEVMINDTLVDPGTWF